MTKGWKQVRCNNKKTILEKPVFPIRFFQKVLETSVQWNLDLTTGRRLAKCVCHINEVLLHGVSFSYLAMTGVKKIVCYTEDFVVQSFIISRFHCNTDCLFWINKHSQKNEKLVNVAYFLKQGCCSDFKLLDIPYMFKCTICRQGNEHQQIYVAGLKTSPIW